MSRTGAQLVRYALEQLNINQVFGVLGAANREIYSELNRSGQITAHLVNQELSAAFMADAISRTAEPDSQSRAIGTMIINSDAIISQGLAEAFTSGVPMLIIAGALDSHGQQINALPMLRPVTKACLKVSDLEDIVSSIFEAYQLSTTNKPGPVYVEISAQLQMHEGDIHEPLPLHLSAANQPQLDQEKVDSIAQTLIASESPALFAGWSAVPMQIDLINLADALAAPVCTSLQGISAFPANHPLHAGLLTNPSAKRSLKDCDCLLVIGQSNEDLDYLELPEQLLYLEPDAIKALLYRLQELQSQATEEIALRLEARAKTIAKYKTELRDGWLQHNSKGLVNPAVFFNALAKYMDSQAIVVTGHGTHRTLAAELLPINSPRGFICPTSFNAMGYSVPAVNAIKLANPNKQVVGIVGDGAMIINGMEALTAAREKLGAIYCLFNNSKVSTGKNTGHINWGAFAEAIECGYFPVINNQGIDTIVRRALETAAQGQPVIIEVCIDYSRRSFYAEHLEKIQQARLPGRDKLGMVKRAIVRKIMGERSR